MKGTYEALASRLRIKQMQLLIAIDEHKSLHKASTAMHMTQSAASKALGELELMLDARLFERTKGGLIPNAYGHAAIRYARGLACDLSALCDEVIQIRSGSRGRLAIGAIMGAIPDPVAPAVNAMCTSHPELAIEIVEDTSSRLLSLLDEGRLDLVVGRASVAQEPSKYAYQALCGEPLSVVVGWDHAKGRRRGITLTDLREHRWITYPSHMPLHDLLDRELELAGMRMPDGPISTSSALVTVALLNGNANLVSLIPTAVAKLFSERRMLRILPIALKSESRTFGIVTRREGALSAAARTFIRLLKDRTRDKPSA